MKLDCIHFVNRIIYDIKLLFIVYREYKQSIHNKNS